MRSDDRWVYTRTIAAKKGKGAKKKRDGLTIKNQSVEGTMKLPKARRFPTGTRRYTCNIDVTATIGDIVRDRRMRRSTDAVVPDGECRVHIDRQRDDADVRMIE